MDAVTEQWTSEFKSFVPEDITVTVEEQDSAYGIVTWITLDNGLSDDSRRRISIIATKSMIESDPEKQAKLRVYCLRKSLELSKDEYNLWMRSPKKWNGDKYEVVDG